MRSMAQCTIVVVAVSGCGARQPCPAASLFEEVRATNSISCADCEDPWQECVEAFDACGAAGDLSDLDEASREICMANHEMDKEAYDEALGHLASAEKLAPGWAMVHHFKTQLGVQNDMADLAMASALEVVRLDPGWAWGQYDLATAQVMNGDMESAEISCRTFVELMPDEPAGHWLLSILIEGNGDSIGALKDMILATELDPEEPLYAQGLYELLLEIVKANGAGPDTANLVAKTGDRLLEMLPDEPGIWTLVTTGRVLIGDVKGAMSLADTALQSGQKEGILLVAVALGCKEAGGCEEYLAQFEDLEGIDPAVASASLAQVAASLAREDMRKEARELVERAVLLDPGNYLARLLMASLWFMKCDADDVLDQIEQVLVAKPGFVPALVIEGTVLATIGKHEEALEIMKQLVEEQESTASGYTIAAVVHAMKGEHEQSALMYEKALALAPGDLTLIAPLVEEYFSLKNSELATKYAKLYCESLPESPGCMSLDGLATTLAGKTEEGVAKCMKATLLFPGMSSVWMRLSRSLSLAGKDEEAAEAMAKAIAIDPGLASLGTASTEQGKKKKAQDKGLAAPATPSLPSCKLEP